MTEQEVKEKIAREIGQHTENCAWEVCSKSEQDAAFRSASFIVDTLLKQAGYVKLAEGDKLICEVAWDLLSPAIKEGLKQIEEKTGWRKVESGGEE